jgi:hypothetical protein
MADVNPGAAPAPVATPTNTPAPVDAAPVDTNVAADVEADLSDIDIGDGEGAEAGKEPAKAAKADKKDEKEKVAGKKKKFQLKVDGKDEELELDLDNDEEVRKHLQLSKAAYKRMQESAEMRKGVQELIDTLRADPLKVIGDPRLGIPEEVRKKLAQSIIDNEIEELSKTPEQKEKEKLQSEYERLKKEVETEKKAREAAEVARVEQEQARALDEEINSAIEISGLPKNARTVRYMAEALMFCLQNNINLGAKDLIPYVKKQTLDEFREIITALPDEEFEGWLGKDQIKRIRQRHLAKRQAPPSAQDIKPTGQEAAKTEEQKRETMRAFFGRLGK